MRASMPCCEESPTVAAPEIAAVRPATAAAIQAPVALAQSIAAPRIVTVDVIRRADIASEQPPVSPPLFLLNAQFLI